MSVLGLSDFILGDLLSDKNMKPWWEKARGYCYAACVAASLFMFYFTLTTSTACVPLSQNVSLPFELTKAHTSLMNNYCINQFPWFVSYSGIILLAFVAILLIASASWLYFPAVINSFNTFKEVETIIKELLDRNKDLKSMVTEPVDKDKGDSSQLRTAHELLFGYKCKSTVATFYVIRNVISLVIIFLSLCFSIATLVKLFGSGNRFHCSLTEGYHLEVHGVGDPFKYFCSLNIRRQLIPFVIVFSIAAFCQIAFTSVGIIKARNITMPDHIRSKDLQKGFKFSQFMINFWKSADPTRSGAFGSFVEFVFSEEALDKMKTQLNNVVKSNDMRFIEMYCKLRKDGERHVMKILAGVFRKNKEDSQGNVYGANDIIKCLKHIQCSVEDSETEDLIKIAVKHSHWPLLVAVLSCLNSEVSENEEYIKRLNLNLDELEEYRKPHSIPYVPVHNIPRSILYYALSEPEYFKAAEYLFGAMKDNRPKYVHSGLQTWSAKDFVKKVFDKNPHLTEQKLTELQKLIEASEGGKSVPSCSEMEIRRILMKHQLSAALHSDEFRNSEEYIHHKMMIENEISSYRFTHWDTDAQNFAKYLASTKQWDIFITLLNSYIAETTMNLRHFECGVYEFDVDEGHNKRSPFDLCLNSIINSAPSFNVPKFIPFIKVLEHMLYCTIPSEPGQSHPAMWVFDRVGHYDVRQELKLKLEKSMRRKFHGNTESDNQTQQPTETQQGAETQQNSLPEEEASQSTPLLPVTCESTLQTPIDMEHSENIV